MLTHPFFAVKYQVLDETLLHGGEEVSICSQRDNICLLHVQLTFNELSFTTKIYERRKD